MISPQMEDGVVFKNEFGDEVSYDEWHPVDDDVALDGSAYPHIVRSLTRAGWALLFFNKETGKQSHSATGLVWGTLPQTSMAGEHVSFTALCQAARSDVDAHVDCKTVETAFGSTLEKRLRPSSRYAGLLRSVSLEGSEAKVRKVTWTKAHLSQEHINLLEGEAKHIARANHEVDLLAKAGAQSHPPQDSLLVRDVERQLEKARVVLKLATSILPLYSESKFDLLPKVDRPGGRSVVEVFGQGRSAGAVAKARPDRDQTIPAADPDANRHVWKAGQCDACLIGRSCVAESVDVCTGVPPIVRKNLTLKLGHSMRRVHTTDSTDPIWMCGRCGANGCKRFVGLHKVCRGTPTEGTTGHDTLRRVKEGKSPDCRQGKEARITYVSRAG